MVAARVESGINSNAAAAQNRRNIASFTCPLVDYPMRATLGPNNYSASALFTTDYNHNFRKRLHPCESGCILTGDGLRQTVAHPVERRKVSKVISGGQFKRIGNPMVPKPGFVYRVRGPILYSPMKYFLAR